MSAKPRGRPARGGGAPGLDALVALARKAQRSSYSPYSRYAVGAAVRGGSGRAYGGCNVENASYGLSLCAERSAVAAALLAGEKRLLGAAVVTRGDEPAPPCGMCRQVMREFGSSDMPVALVAGRRRVDRTLGELLPMAFSKRFF